MDIHAPLSSSNSEAPLTWTRTRELMRLDFQRYLKLMGESPSLARRLFWSLLPAPLGLRAYRLYRYAYLRGWRNLAQFMFLVSRYVTGMDIPPSTSIGAGCLLAHGSIVLCGRIGDNFTMMGHGGLGGGFDGDDDIGGGPGLPVVGDDVSMGIHAKVLGAVRVGSGARLGPSCTVTRDVPAGAIVAAAPSRVMNLSPAVPPRCRSRRSGRPHGRHLFGQPMSSKIELVTIVIVNWNVRELLHACLASVYTRGGLAPEQMRVIVVDNASADDSAQMVRAHFPQVVLVANQDNVGFGRANNQALPMCVGPYVLLLNPDTVVAQGAIAQLVQQMDEQPDVAAIGCRLLNADGTLQRWTGGAYPRLLNLMNHNFFLDRLLPASWRPMPLYLDRDVPHDIDVDWVSGACMMLRAGALGGKLFNTEYFMYGEDMELCHRLKQAGGRIVYSPRVSIIHYQGASMKKQEGDVLLSSLKGPRQFYRQMRGARALRIYDAITVSGFALRWWLYRMGAALRPGRGSLAARARSSRDMMQRAWTILRAG